MIDSRSKIRGKSLEVISESEKRLLNERWQSDKAIREKKSGFTPERNIGF